ncbi:MAG: glycoside hydrolase family 130 protein [Anaerolineae bacterium]|nr:glycoside hydrolase family 130 protein [Anaerolineae bacterium]
MEPITSSTIIHRHPGNPILTAADIPYPAQLIFNAGVCKTRGQYWMVFRNDFNFSEDLRHSETNLGLATSSDGIHWQAAPQPIFSMADADITRAYDPRLVVMEDGTIYLCFAVDTHHGVRAGIARTEDFEHFEIISLSLPENRNIVLFPQKIGSRYVRLDRPFPVYSRGGQERFDIWISESPDLVYWGQSKLLLAVEEVPFANTKLGPAAPPIRTEAGWLALFHAVDTDPARGKNGWEARWQKRYTVGAMLLDLDQPWKVIAHTRQPLMVPEADYEIGGGYRNNVIFPCGTVLEDNGELKIYYGAADTVTCLATTNLDDLLGVILANKV